MSNNWTREQLLIAINLYCQLPFGKFHQGNPLIIATAAKIGRTPSALAMKLSNLASLDPDITGSGRKGLAGASRLDRDMWAEFSDNPDQIGYESQVLVDRLAQQEATLTPLSSDETTAAITVDYYTENTLSQTKVRVKQAFFRKAVLSSYQGRCCITGLAEPKLLIASHIVPWSKNAQQRLNPANGLCLSVLHDKAYDQGLLTVTPDYIIRVSPRLFVDQSDLAKDYLWQLDGKPITLPQKFIPNPEFLAYHVAHIFN